jgi:hypothetical protein
LECEEIERKAGVHARESSEEKTGNSSKGLAVEQLVVLRKGRRGMHVRPQTPGKVKNRTLKTEGCGTQSFLTT